MWIGLDWMGWILLRSLVQLEHLAVLKTVLKNTFECQIVISCKILLSHGLTIDNLSPAKKNHELPNTHKMSNTPVASQRLHFQNTFSGGFHFWDPELMLAIMLSLGLKWSLTWIRVKLHIDGYHNIGHKGERE